MYLLLALTQAVAAQEMTQAEAKRLMILQSERRQVVMDLAAEVGTLPSAKGKARLETQNRIETLRQNLRDLDTEITNTGNMPKIRPLIDQAIKPAHSQESSTNAKAEKHEPWDVFENF